MTPPNNVPGVSPLRCSYLLAGHHEVEEFYEREGDAAPSDARWRNLAEGITGGDRS